MYAIIPLFVNAGAVLFSFTAVIDLIITLEFNGIIRNFMSEYLNLGEPYLASPWGAGRFWKQSFFSSIWYAQKFSELKLTTKFIFLFELAIALFDAIGFLPMYLGLIYLVSNGYLYSNL